MRGNKERALTSGRDVPTVILEPATGGLASLLSSLRDLWNRRSLLILLSKREIAMRYQHSTIGVAWSLAKPLATLTIYFFVIGQFLGAARSIPSFAIFIYTGFIGWSLFADTVSSMTISMVNNAGILRKTYVPRALFPIASLTNPLITTGIQILLLGILCLIVGQSPALDTLGFALGGLLLLLLLATGTGLMLSVINVIKRDTQHILELALMLLFWVSPIVYSIYSVSSVISSEVLLKIYEWNPITVGVLSMQRGLWAAGGSNPAMYWPSELPLMLATSLALGVIWSISGLAVFRHFEGKIVDKL